VEGWVAWEVARAVGLFAFVFSHGETVKRGERRPGSLRG